MRKRFSAEYYIQGILAGDRLVLSQAITVIESQLTSDQVLANNILTGVLLSTNPEQSSGNQSVRVGITGVPGVGKSLFIEALGNYLTGQGKRLAVLAVDPTSQRSGGSLLGDKTRMDTLSLHPLAYIRPSPAGHTLGGVTHRTRETILLCEAAGFEVIFVETVGVGQSETLVHNLVDFFLLLMLAGAGDELQGLKRGIMELADALAITKADGINQPAAEQARIAYQNALHLFPPTDSGWSPPVITCSALTGLHLPAIWQLIEDHRQLTMQTGHWAGRRQEQQLDWFRDALRQQVEGQFYAQPGTRDQIAAAEAEVRRGTLLPVQAVEKIMQATAQART